MGKLAIMQPYLFPYIGYWQLINSCDEFVLLDDVNFITRGWINRNKILINGKEHLFTMPVKEISQNKLICQSYFDLDAKWKNKFLKTLNLSYRKAPHFAITIGLIEEILSHEKPKVSDFIYFSIKKICSYLSIETEIVFSSQTWSNPELKAQDKILYICHEKKAEVYINLIGGTELYDKEKFMARDIELYFLKTDNIEYKQFNDTFVPWLSIIDIMMFNPAQTIKKYLNMYLLI